MKDSQLIVDENLIDSLVSGQLTGEQYRAALRALDAKPAKWRDCALAFLEEQALQTELRALAQGDINWTIEASGESTISVVTNPHVSVENKNAKVASISSRLSSRARSMLSTAALLLVSFTVGWLGSEVLAERERSAKSESATNSLAQSPPNVLQSLNDQYVVDVPGAFDRGIPRAIRQLEHDGKISVQSYEMLMGTTLEDGSAAVIPVQQLILGPGRRESY